MEALPKRLFPFFLHFMKPYKWYLGGLFMVALSWATHVSLLPYVLKLLIDTVTQYSNDL
ncbi:MAG: hypothetical protein IPP74_04905 [Alphaproteobacteria bacterium]|nr:hypothetical protein [Alphaproteobacteria bacterium]